MIAKIYWGPRYERMVECDAIHQSKKEGSFELSLYKDKKLVEFNDFKDKVTIFIMENGKTIDRVDFDPSPEE